MKMYSLEQAAEAYTLIATGHVTGKLVITIS
jgi:hypothetical protein